MRNSTVEFIPVSSLATPSGQITTPCWNAVSLSAKEVGGLDEMVLDVFFPLVQTPYKSLIKDKNWEPKKTWSVALRLSLKVEWTQNSSGCHLPSCQFTYMYVCMSACLHVCGGSAQLLVGRGGGGALCSRHSMSPILPITKMRVWCYVGSLERLISSHNNRDQQGRIS